MINFQRFLAWLFPDRRPEREKAREREFIRAANSLKTLSVTDRGGMSIDPEELREHIIASREQLKHLDHKPGAPSKTLNVSADFKVAQETNDAVEAAVELQDCIEVVAWRRPPSGAAVRYVCFQSTSTGRFAVATALLFSGSWQCLPSWMEANTGMQVANAIKNAELRWFATVGDAMDAWDAEL
ncbi:hypothetical protein H045_18995 [Pseudomonas poae RE*1-1-14]|uniref:hypothetical protein n=1 Tax=Pseudomonas poae TaxID=200451 RepID=UPI0002AF4B5D|nr:hypothetical protein [Pseudomonas poae]AGE27861.1 hypothetical protein H045_18995 [Pseudomonas poae RE*1-1-14]